MGNYFKKFYSFLNKNKFGLSVLELIITIGIFTLISVSFIVRYPTFSSQLSLNRTSQEIALSLHETRMYGIGVKKFGGRTDISYGMNFDLYNFKKFILFADIDGDLNRNIDNSENVIVYNIGTAETIESFCVGIGDRNCEKIVASEVISRDFSSVLDIIFERPAPTVYIMYKGERKNFARIVVKSPRGSKKYVDVWSTGQVSISNYEE